MGLLNQGKTFAKNALVIKQNTKIAGLLTAYITDSALKIRTSNPKIDIYYFAGHKFAYYFNVNAKLYFLSDLTSIPVFRGAHCLNNLCNIDGKSFEQPELWYKSQNFNYLNVPSTIYKLKYSPKPHSNILKYSLVVVGDFKGIDSNYINIHRRTTGSPMLGNITLKLESCDEDFNKCEYITTNMIYYADYDIKLPDLKGLKNVNSQGALFRVVSDSNRLNSMDEYPK